MGVLGVSKLQIKTLFYSTHFIAVIFFKTSFWFTKIKTKKLIREASSGFND